MKVFVYLNLHLTRRHDRPIWSVKALTGSQKGRVVLHCGSLRLVDVEFRVQPAGRDRVRRTGVKCVHAGVVGTLLAWGGGETNYDEPADYPDIQDHSIFTEGERVTYNPKHHNTFVLAGSEQPIASADHVLMHDGKVWICRYKGICQPQDEVVNAR